MKIDEFIAEFYEKYIDMVDRILPVLMPSEQIIFNQLFARTVGEGTEFCRISYKDFERLTGLSTETIKKALKRLISRGILKVVKAESPRVAKTYSILWPREMNQYSKFQRNPTILLKNMGIAEKQYGSILKKLTDEDRNLLDILKQSLSSEEESNLRIQANRNLKEGETPENKFLEIIVLTKFGPEKLRKYE